jgi:peroxiredoxin
MTKIQVGDRAPEIETTDARGKAVTLDNYKSQYVLIAFLRYAGCPFCNLSIHRLAMEHKLLLDSGCDVLTFIQSDKEQVDKNIYDRHKVVPKFFDVTPSLKNTTKFMRDIPHWIHAVKDHGFKQGKIDGKLLIAPAIFLVHVKSRKIIHSDYASDLFEHETFSPIYDKILTNQS